MKNIKKLNNNWNLNLLNILKLSYHFSSENILVNIVKKNLTILKILKKYNFINDFRIIKGNLVIIYLFYKNNKKLWRNLKVLYRSSHFFF